MLIFATTQELENWMQTTAPDNAPVLLREASGIVSDACQCDIYDTDADDKPTDAKLLEAMMEATCAQAEAWSAADMDPTKGPGGQAPRLTTSAQDGSSLSFDTYLTAPDRNDWVKYIAPSAFRRLRSSGLASGRVQSW